MQCTNNEECFYHFRTSMGEKMFYSKNCNDNDKASDDCEEIIDK